MPKLTCSAILKDAQEAQENLPWIKKPKQYEKIKAKYKGKGERMAIFQSSFWEDTKELNHRDKILLLSLFSFCNEANNAHPGMKTLSRMTGMHTNSIVRHVNKLNEVGLLDVKRHGSDIYTNQYKVLIRFGSEEEEQTDSIGVKLFNMLEEHKLSTAARIIYLFLHCKGMENDLISVSQKYISEMVGMSRKTANIALSELRNSKLILSLTRGSLPSLLSLQTDSNVTDWLLNNTHRSTYTLVSLKSNVKELNGSCLTTKMLRDMLPEISNDSIFPNFGPEVNAMARQRVKDTILIDKVIDQYREIWEKEYQEPWGGCIFNSDKRYIRNIIRIHKFIDLKEWLANYFLDKNEWLVENRHPMAVFARDPGKYSEKHMKIKRDKMRTIPEESSRENIDKITRRMNELYQEKIDSGMDPKQALKEVQNATH